MKGVVVFDVVMPSSGLANRSSMGLRVRVRDDVESGERMQGFNFIALEM
jgi:hypothetical protein